MLVVIQENELLATELSAHKLWTAGTNEETVHATCFAEKQ